MTTTVDSDKPRYRDPASAIEERVGDLLSRMTLEEKLAQLGSRWVFELADDEGRLTSAVSEVLRDGLGHVTRISGASSLRPREAAALANDLQRHLVEETRLGIPAIVHEEICSGLMARDATVFPQAIGLASTWEPTLVEALAASVREQMRAMGAHQGLGPVLDICRDPRWGRLEETFGEDPYLVTRMGLAFVRGLQGDEPRTGVVATAKHLVGYGASEGARNWAPAQIPARELREVYLHPFEAAVRMGRVGSVMNAYNELDGIPCAADGSLLTELLRGEWGFSGSVVSDYFSVRQLAEYHRFAVDAQDAAVKTLDAGIDVELPSIDCYGEPLLEAARNGLVAAETLDEAVRRVLRTKFELGLFEEPFVDPEHAQASSATSAHEELARTIARKSLVLLRNDGTLPLAPSAGSVAVIGPGADEARYLLGDYAYAAHVESLQDVLESGEDPFSNQPPPGRPKIAKQEIEAPSLLDALRERLGDRVRFARGCDVTGDERDGFEEAVAAAREADVAILMLGDKSGLTEECTSGESRDVASLTLPGVQEDLLLAVLETGTPVVLVLVAGRPYASRAHEQCAAVLLAWLPGQEGGAAIADTLVGTANPGGKLPVSYPRSSGHIPVFYGHKATGGRSHPKVDYADAPISPLYPFGHGLSYTTFALTEPAARAGEVSWTETLTVDVTVSNTGDREGDEVVQLYVRDPYATVTRPLLELKGFVRVTLPPGGSRRITFDVPAAQLGFHGRDLDYVVEPGAVEVFVGTSSADLVDAGTVTLIADPASRPPDKAFDGWVTVE